jgi:hypothetical protein
MTSQGSALTRFRRALKSGNPLLVETAARELTRMDLYDALGVSLVFLAAGDIERYRRAAVRWHARYSVEHRPAADEAQLVLSALLALGTTGPGAPAGAEALAVLFETRGLSREAKVVEDYARRFE